MMIVMKEGATEEQIQAVVDRVESVGCSAHVSPGELLTVIGAIGDRDRVAALGLEGAPGVDHLVPILKPYKLASAQFRKGERTVIDVDGRKVGGDNFALIAGPCTVESRKQTLEVARTVADGGAPCCAAAPTSHGPLRTRSRASARRASGCSPRRGRRPGCRSSPS